MTILPYQERVIAERDELAVRHQRLTEFLALDSTHEEISQPEINRLIRQHHAMSSYLSVLNERIEVFRYDG